MTLCTNGSEPNPSAPPYVWVTWLAAREWLGVLWGVLGWIGVAARSSVHEINTFCATEPPQPVYPGDATVLAAATDPVAFEQLLTYIEQSAYWWVWSQSCLCTAAAAGTCYPVLPTGALSNTSADVLNFRFGVELYANVSGLTIYGCTVRFATVGTGTFGITTIDQTDGTVVTEEFAGVAGLHTYYLATPMALDHTGSSHVYNVILRFSHSGYTFTYENVNVTPVNTTQLHYNKFIYQSDLTSGMIDWTPEHLPMDPVICTADPNPAATTPGAPGAPDTDVPIAPSLECTSTADLCDLVNNLVQSVTSMRQQVDLIQRQNVPFAYTIGTVHSGLTGSGSFSVAGLLGLLIQTSTSPTSWGTSTDDPARFIPSTVSVAVGDSHGTQNHHYCHLTEELWFPDDMGAMTHVDYAFRPGCGGSITELIREP